MIIRCERIMEPLAMGSVVKSLELAPRDAGWEEPMLMFGNFALERDMMMGSQEKRMNKWI